MKDKEFEEKYGFTKKEAKRLDRESLAWENRFEKAEMKRANKREEKEERETKDNWL